MDLKIAAWLDQEDARMATTIRRYGWAITYVYAASEDDSPGELATPFAYTVGLFGLGHPELLIFGVCVHIAHDVLDALARRVRKGENLVPGQLIKLGDRSFIPEQVPNPEQILFDANRFYQRPHRRPVSALQLSYDDDNGLYPWELGFAEPERQPRPGTFRA
jgi:hypothetical protein